MNKPWHLLLAEVSGKRAAIHVREVQPLELGETKYCALSPNLLDWGKTGRMRSHGSKREECFKKKTVQWNLVVTFARETPCLELFEIMVHLISS
jgi:hypothetical protein